MTIAAPLHIGKFIPPPYAGIEAHVDTLLTALAPHLPVALVACRPPWQPRLVKQLPYRLVAAASFGKFASTALSPDILWRIRRELHSRRCNMLHLHAPNPWGDIAALLAAADTPVVLSWHSDIVRQQRLLHLYRGTQRRVLERVDRIIVFTPSHYTSSEQLHQVDVSRKIEVVPMGIDVQRLDRPCGRLPALVSSFIEGRRVILTIGRHVYYKGYEYLIDALARISDDAVLLMVGTGPLTESLRKRISERGLDGRILMLGEVDEATLVSLLHRCDVFTLPSIEPSEAFGIASAEAMACGKPTVVCELGNGVNHLNKDGITSLTVPPRDSASLADAIQQLLTDEELRLRMGGEAHRWVRSEFCIGRMAERTQAIYRALS